MAKLFCKNDEYFHKISKINVASFVCVSRCSHNAEIRSKWILMGMWVKTSNDYKEILGFSNLLGFCLLKVRGTQRQPYRNKKSGYEMRKMWPQIWILGDVGGNPVMAKLDFSVQIPADAAIYIGRLYIYQDFYKHTWGKTTLGRDVARAGRRTPPPSPPSPVHPRGVLVGPGVEK